MSRLERLGLIFSIAFASFVFGFITNHYETFPYSLFRDAYKQSVVLRTSLGLSKPHHLFSAVYKRSGAHTHDAVAVQSGLTLLTSYWSDLDWLAGIKLIDSSGAVLHTWKTNPAEIWSFDLKSTMLDYVHGTYLFPNGDILFNIEYMGLVRMDACGKVKWILDYKTHHSVFRDEEGNFWVSANVERTDKEYLKRFPGLSARIYEDHILLVSPEGEILRDINMLEVIYNNDLQRYLPKFSRRKEGDIFHLNDVESLPRAMADHYPLFEAGDIVVSLRYMHLVLVMDPDTGAVKWHSTDPFIEQHDPDFIGDGWIGIFDNNSEYLPRGQMLGGSRIVAVRPHTGEFKVLYDSNEAEPFYTAGGGKWQRLRNGNLLMVEARAGRAVEVDQKGRTVWEWIQERYNDNLVPEVLEATRYPYTRDQVSTWTCRPAKE